MFGQFQCRQQVQLEAMHEKSGIESMSAFIKMQIFGKPMKVFYVDENSRIFIDMLSDLNARYRTIGVAYDQLVKALKDNFTEKRVNSTIRELIKSMRELVAVNYRIVELAERFDKVLVAKISLGNSLYRALCYNGEKINKENGRLLATNKIYNDGSGKVNINRAYQDFKSWMPSSTRTERPMAHISLNPHPDDRLTDAEFTELAHEYMEKMGFGDMPYMVYKHSDIARQHIHIVALRVGTDGRCISDKNNFYRSKDICRELERKYNLRPSERQKITPDMPIHKVDPNGDLKRQVANVVKMVGMRYKFQTLGEYNAILSLYNIRCEEADGRVNGREYHGLVDFATDDNGKTIAAPFKASRLGKFASRTAIDSRFERAADKIDVGPTKRMVAEVMAQSLGKDDFITRLKDKNIDLILRYTVGRTHLRSDLHRPYYKDRPQWLQTRQGFLCKRSREMVQQSVREAGYPHPSA